MNNCKMPRIFEIMAEKKITATALSAATGISSGNISDWKSGKSAPSRIALQKVSKALDVSIEYLEGATDIKKPMTQDNISEADNKILTLYHQLPPELQEKYMKDLELLSKLSNNQ